MLVVAASVAIAAALVAAYVRVALVDSDEFADRATAALRDDRVRDLIGEKITDDVVLQSRGDLIAARPIIASFASGLVGSRAFTSLFRSAVRDVHRAVFDRDANTLTLTVADVGTVLAAALEQLRPSLAREVEATDRVQLLNLKLGTASASAARFAQRVTVLAWVLLALAIGLAATAIAVAPDRRRAAAELGVGTAVAGVVVAIAYAVARSYVLGTVDGSDEKAAAGAVWSAFFGDLRSAAWVLAGSGAVVAASASSLIRPGRLGDLARRAVEVVTTEPDRPALRALRGVALAATGVLVLVQRQAVVELLITVAGVVLVYSGVTALLRLVYRPPDPEAQPPAARPRRRRSWAPAVIAAALIAATAGAFVASGGTTTASPPGGPCNGHRELCDRPLAAVAMAATHNSMSVPLPGWFSALQERPIAGQLAGGIRGLLIDTHYAERFSNGRLRTEDESLADLRETAETDGVSREAVAAALRIRDRIAHGEDGVRGMYLCHSFCELGATTLSSVLDDLRDFLVSHRDEVVVIVNQDYVAPADFVEAVREAGLERYAYAGPIDERTPTLRSMIDSDRRLVLLAENHAGGAPWYRLAYERIMQETPFSFSRTAQLTSPADRAASCRENRGPSSAPMFLINHWITTDPVPRPSDSAKVNAYAPLLARARECERLRGRPPGLIAVDFYEEGDLFEVVDALNGVG